ncbi:RNA-directed DNA polymerase from mobile element jockey-like [Plakobranchus ocellatus]|uniref:RNA-directed DNA polymerase from mobile element jockey-like n=1 Tax=Plakobranchus ocellatus TaxID=259542 RepID=A0AAV4BVP9_9GAST|nr:RNA-directed DNA polymerase from mobile element jockey-like [Plakobranchus ocellatus]
MSKENWINEKCKEIEQQRKHAPQIMYRNIEEITGKRTVLSTGCIKAMNGDIIIDKEKILERWAEYIRELFKDDRKDPNIMKNNFAGPHIMKEEVETAIKKMKHGKATSPDNISVALIEALEDFGIGKVTHLLNEIYDVGQIPTDLSKSIFIALPKKPGATECELHRTISLMSHITKILLKIIMLRIRNKIKPEIAEEQCGFVGDKETSNAIYILRTLIERAQEVQKDKTNERVLSEANKRRSLVRTIRKRQATFVGHVVRRGKLEHLVTTGKFEGKRGRGRPREKIIDGLATWLGPGKVSDILAAVKDRDLWREMIANVYKQGT